MLPSEDAEVPATTALDSATEASGGARVVRTRSAKSLVRQDSGGPSRRRSSRHELSEHEIIRRRSSRQLDRSTTHEDSAESASQPRGSSTEYRRRASKPSEVPRRPSNLSEASRRPSQSSEAPRRPSMSSTSLTTEQADELKGKKHAKLVERFQIRQLPRSPTDASVNSNAARIVRHPSRESEITGSTSGDTSKATTKMTESSTARSSAPNDTLRPLQHFQAQITGRQPTTELDQRALYSNRTHEGNTTIGTARQYGIDVESLSVPLSVGERFWLWFYALKQPMSPFSATFRGRQVVMMIALAVHVVYFPLQTAFRDPTAGSTLEMGVETVFILDFLLMFNTSIVDKRGTLITDRRQICRQYLSGWFLPDLVSSIPVEWILVRGNSNSADKVGGHFLYDIVCRIPRIIHTIRLARFIWVVRLDRSENNLFTWLFYSRYAHLLRIAWIILALVLAAHYLACSWKLLKPFDATTSVAETYISNFYDVLQLLQGQGVPTTTIEQNIFSAAAILMGSVALAIVFGHVGILVSNFNANSTNYQRKMESVFAIMSKLQLPAPLRERIHQYYEHLWREYESLDGEIVSFSKGLSHTLELEVVLFKYMDLIMHVPFWCDGSPDFQKQLMLHLSVRVYLPDDFIIRRGEVGDEFYMINRGVCELVLGPDSVETTSPPPLADCYEGGSDSNRGAGSSRSGGQYGGRHGGDGSSTARRTGRGGDDSSVGHRPAYGGDGISTAGNDRFDKLRAPLTARPRDEGDEEEDVGNISSCVRVLRRGQTFGELALITNYERTANVRALTYVEMCVLKRSDIQAIFVKHPKDRKEVLTQLLMRVIDHNERNHVRCPLKVAVQKTLGREQDRHFSAIHAAMMITNAINTDREDESIKFGIGLSLESKLQNMVRTHHATKTNASTVNEDILEERQATRTGSSSDQQTEARIARLEATQVQLLDLVQVMRNEVQSMRRAYLAVVCEKRGRGQSQGQESDDTVDADTAANTTSIDSDEPNSFVALRRVPSQPGEHVSIQMPIEDQTPCWSSLSTRITQEQVTEPIESKAPKPSDAPAAARKSVATGVKQKVRPTMGSRRTSYREPTVHPVRMLGRVASTPSSLEHDPQWSSHAHALAAAPVAPTNLVDVNTPVVQQTMAQRATVRASLLSPLRSIVATLVPTATSSAPTTSAPLGDQLFHVRSHAHVVE